MQADKQDNVQPDIQIDRLADEFEARWSSESEKPPIDEFLERVTPNQRGTLFVELLTIEKQLCEANGAPFDFEAYEEEFPEYRESIAKLREGVDATLSLLGKASDGSRSSAELSQSHRIGPYKLLQQIGAGGMGQVYLAEQLQPVRRRVALKIIKSDSPTKEILARFEAERQALAMMDHQNIAKVLDAGITEDGKPYFAMELVKGVPITEYCDANKLATGERLILFAQTCRAIQHAHQKGIIHRDLKPSNVLVTLYDGEPVAKVIDFGLAKAVHETINLAHRTLFTRYGQVVGTLAYMSPEQAEMNALDVDTRTDVYSLGVILFELLTGSTPISAERIRKEAFDQILRLIREEESPRPSTRLSESGAAIVGISQQRKTDAKRLNLLLKGDLDWIAIKALEKDRNRRYEGANSLADDIDRFINGDPISARPPSTVYRLKKVYRKHRASLLSATAVVFMLICGLIGTGVMWRRSVAATKIASTEAARATESERAALQATREMAIERDRAQQAEKQANTAARRARLAQAETERQQQFALLAAKRAEIATKLAEQKSVSALQSAKREAAARDLAEDERKKAKILENAQRIARYRAEEEAKRANLALTEKEAVLKLLFESKSQLEQLLDELRNKSKAAEVALDLQEAQQRIQVGDAGLAQRILVEIPKPDRGLEWRILAKQARLEEGIADFQERGEDSQTSPESSPAATDVQRLAGHQGAVYAVALSIDGKTMASAGADKTIRVWDTGNWELQTVLSGHTDAVRAVAFLPDGNTIASAGFDGTVRLWEISSGNSLHTFSAQRLKFLCLAVSNDGRKLFAGGGKPDELDAQSKDYLRWKGGLICWDVSDRSIVFELEEQPAMIRAVAVTDDGVELFTGGYDGSLNGWNAKDGSAGRDFSGHSHPVFAIAIDGQNNQLCSISGPSEPMTGLLQEQRFVGGFRLWDLRAGNQVSQIKASEDRLLAVSLTSQRVVTGGADQTVRFWDIATNQHLVAFPTIDSDVLSLAISSDRDLLVSGGDDGVVHVWDGRLPEHVEKFTRDRSVSAPGDLP